MPERLGAEYVAEDNTRKVPVMLHRAIVGSMERFIGILIEHYAGSFPLWLAPIQAVVASITDEAAAYAEEVAGELRAAGLRVVADSSNEKIGYKVREHSLAKIPVMLVAGRREAAERGVSLRRLGSPAQEALALTEAIARLKAEAAPPGQP
jgi:threonyl-tRNA synthetase